MKYDSGGAGARFASGILDLPGRKYAVGARPVAHGISILDAQSVAVGFIGFSLLHLPDPGGLLYADVGVMNPERGGGRDPIVGPNALKGQGPPGHEEYEKAHQSYLFRGLPFGS